MIEKMTFVSITGPKEDFDRMVEEHLSRYEVHLENALSEFKTVQNLTPFIEKNPYKDALASLNRCMDMLPETSEQPDHSISIPEAMDIAQKVHHALVGLEADKAATQEKLNEVLSLKKVLEPFKEVNADIQKLNHFRYIHTRFGRIAKDHYRKLEHFLLENSNSIFYKCSVDAEYVWGMYFVPDPLCAKVDAMYASMHFEQIELPEECEDVPMEYYLKLEAQRQKLEAELESISQSDLQVIKENTQLLVAARAKLQKLSDSFDIRKLAACFKENDSVYYILCGWMPTKSADAFQNDIADDDNILLVEEDAEESAFQGPPTKLKNPRFLKPFEMYTKMYGLPDYNEMDPTLFIALTYTFIFGAMFGDVGQGLLLAIGGALLYKFKKNNLAAIISCAGIFSTIFGFLFGSVFGFENIIEAVWLHPRTHTMKVPMIGELNTVFVVAVGLGMGLILVTMIFHIINAAREKDLESLLFDKNGVAGLVFYGSLVVVVALLMTHNPMPATIVLAVMFGLPLLLIALKEPLGKLLEKHSNIFPENKGMFVVETFFELFEVLLSYFSNTLSFIRVGAFAISHAAMMEVVLMLAGAESGSTNWIIIVFGNLFVCGLEGLIVGIQVLRLEYYEMFSRFYKGTGREFISSVK